MFCHPLKKGTATIVIVDGYSIGRHFAPILQDLGYLCIHVQSANPIPAIYASSFQPKYYKINLIYTGDNFNDITNKLKTHNVQHVIPGTEPAVELADALSEKLGVLSNGTRKSLARRDKFHMIEALKSSGLQTVDHIKTNDEKEILNFTKKIKRWPIVIKPLKSGGADKIFFCRSENEIIEGARKILGSKNIFNDINTEVLAESYLEGDSYVVNMVSVGGKHILSDLWVVGKKPPPAENVVYYYQHLLPSSYHRKEKLVNYTRKALDALEVQHGASHNEIIWTKTGPVLVESAARIMGAINPNIISSCLGQSQLELTLASYLQPELFSTTDLDGYKLKKYCMAKFLVSYQEGEIKKIKFLDEIKALPSYVEMSFNGEIGKEIKKTQDLFSIPGIVYLCHENEDVIWNDYQIISEFERKMFEV